MAKVRLGIDQVTAWVLAVAVGAAVFGAGYFATKLGAQGGEDDAVSAPSSPSSSTEPSSAAAIEEGVGDLSAESTAAEISAATAAEHAATEPPPSPAEPSSSAAIEEGVGDPSADVNWAYSGSNGPDHWAGLSPAFKTCDTGKRQSPVDIDAVITNGKLLPLRFHYKPDDVLIKNDGHTIRGDVPQGSYIEIEGERFDLAHFHFHAPSEHKVSGIPYDLELHYVHKNADGHTAILSILFEEGAEHRALNKIWNVMPLKKGSYDEPVDIDPAAFLPERRLYYTYVGSLTEPPCTEGVRWFVLTTPLHISPKQVDRFVNVAKFNARPVQPLSGRKVQKSTR
jgi:carbonic anhydrase